jgi:hypothetical protein
MYRSIAIALVATGLLGAPVYAASTPNKAPAVAAQSETQAQPKIQTKSVTSKAHHTMKRHHVRHKIHHRHAHRIGPKMEKSQAVRG